MKVDRVGAERREGSSAAFLFWCVTVCVGEGVGGWFVFFWGGVALL